MRRSFEQQQPDADPRDQLNLQDRDGLVRNFTNIGLRSSGNTSALPRVQNNSTLLGVGTHILDNSKTGTRFDGVPGAVCSSAKQVFSASTTSVSGIDFPNIVQINATSSVIFNNCRIFNTITMLAGAKAHYVGCTFLDKGTVQNSGIAANAYIIGCINKTGIAHSNVTIIAETN